MGIFDKEKMDKKIITPVGKEIEADKVSKLQGSERFKEDKVLICLSKVVEGSCIKEDTLYIEALDLTIEIQVPHVNGAIVQLVFILKHRLFQEDMIETVAGVGVTFDKAIEQGVMSFTSSALDAITKALKNESGQAFVVELPNRVNYFKCYQSEVSIQGKSQSGDSIDFWRLLGEDIKRCLGNKKIYMIKVYAARTPEGINCECRINDLVYPNISRVLNKIASGWEGGTKMYSQKQVFVIVQDDETYVPYTLGRKELESQTLNALLLYRDCKSETDYECLYGKILNACENVSLATELFNFIPEIVTEIIFSDVHYSDEVMFIKGAEHISLYRHQLSTYDWIYNVVDRIIRAGYLEKNQIDCIIYHSSALYSIKEAIGKGSKLKDLFMVGIGFEVSNDYQIL